MKGPPDARGGNYPLPKFSHTQQKCLLKRDLEYGKRSKSDETKMSCASQVVSKQRGQTVPDEMETELLAHLDFICFLEIAKETRIIMKERKEMSVRPMFDGAQQKKKLDRTSSSFLFRRLGSSDRPECALSKIIRLRAPI